MDDSLEVLAQRLEEAVEEVTTLEEESSYFWRKAQMVGDSTSFRLGSLILDLWKRPSRVFGFPQRARDLVRSSAAVTSAAAADNSSSTAERGRSGDLRARELLSRLKLPSRTTAPGELRGIRIGSILTPRLEQSLQSEVDLVPITGSLSAGVDTVSEMELFLVESAWNLLDDDQHAHPQWGGDLGKWLDRCAEAGVPTAFWYTEPESSLEFFADLMKKFDHVFVLSKRIKKVVTELLPDLEVDVLRPAVDDRLFNPIRLDTRETIDVLYDGWADLSDLPEIVHALAALKDRRLVIVDSRWEIAANPASMNLAGLGPSIVGSVDDSQHSALLKMARVSVVFGMSLKSPERIFENILKSLACGTPVIYQGPPLEVDLDGVATVDDSAELLTAVNRLIDDHSERARLGHLGARAVMACHTIRRSVRTLLECCSVSSPISGDPMISMITCTKRPELIPRCIERFVRQRYPDKELILLVNTREGSMEETERRLADIPNARAYRIDPEKNVGFCMNFGISRAQGRYWAKADDDDSYGRNYLQDVVQACRYSGAKIVGKPQFYVYLESTNRTYARMSGADREGRYLREGYVCGATLAGSRSVLDEVRFPEDCRTSVDTRFLNDCHARGVSVFCADRFNFIAFRSSTVERHTWKAAEATILKNAVFVGEGIAAESVML